MKLTAQEKVRKCGLRVGCTKKLVEFCFVFPYMSMNSPKGSNSAIKNK